MPLKDPNAKLPYGFDWSKWLANEGDTAATAVWTVPAGIVKEVSPAPSLVDGMAIVWLSGGTAGVEYDVTCRLTTTGGRIDDRTMRIAVRER